MTEYWPLFLIAIVILFSSGPSTASIRANEKLSKVLRELDPRPEALSPQARSLAGDPDMRIPAIMVHRDNTGLTWIAAKRDVEAFVQAQKATSTDAT